MATERQIPGGPYVNETGTFQSQVPGGPYLNETASAPVSVTVPAAAIVVATAAPSIAQPHVVTVPAAAIVVAALAPTVVNTSPVVSADALAQLYGGAALRRGKRKKKRPPPPIEVMVRAIVANDPEGKAAVVRLLPEVAQQRLPDVEVAPLYRIIDQIEASVASVRAQLERLYELRIEEEERLRIEAFEQDEDDVMLLLL